MDVQEIVCEQIKQVKQSLQQLKKAPAMLDDKRTQENILRQKNLYKSLLKDYLQYHHATQQKQDRERGCIQKGIHQKQKML